MKNLFIIICICSLFSCNVNAEKSQFPMLKLFQTFAVNIVSTGTGTGTGTGTTTGTTTGTGAGTTAIPTITSFTPISGVLGDSVTITGTNFSATASSNTVKFNGTTATVYSASTTSLIIAVPTGATTGTITVTCGTNTATSTGSFTVTPSWVYSGQPLKTGQTSCYDVSNNPVGCSVTYKGQDAQENHGAVKSYTGPTAHATFTSDYTTTDNVTGLVWKTCSQGLSGANCTTDTAVTLSWDNASSDITNGCNALNNANSGKGYAGKKNWRLPKLVELSTLMDLGKASGAAINTSAFPATVAAQHWSSTTPIKSITYLSGYVSFSNGGLSANDQGVSYYVRCVSGTSLIETHTYTDNGNGTVKDNITGLIWQKCSGGLNDDSTCSGTATTYTWTDAITYCNTLPLASKSWRLPNRNEMQSIVDFAKISGTTIDTTAFPGTPASFYWSSTTFAPTTSSAWHVDFFTNGRVDSPDKTYTYNVRCVSGL